MGFPAVRPRLTHVPLLTVVVMCGWGIGHVGAAEPTWLSEGERKINEVAAWSREIRLEEDVSTEPYLDLAEYLRQRDPASFDDGMRGWILFPEGLIYRPYLAGPKASRMATQMVRSPRDAWLWDVWLGDQIGILRWGSLEGDWPVGFQIDVEGSAQIRLDLSHEVDVRSADFRGGVPLTFGSARHQTKIAYYHISSHLGDEFLLAHPTFPRLNYSRDAIVIGHSFYPTPRLRLYAEAGWGFRTEISEPWEFQFGLDYAPAGPTLPRGEPFFAVNGHLREEVSFGGGLSVQTGWAWRSGSGRSLRLGFSYYNGPSQQFSFFQEHEQLIGLGLWYDP